MVNLAWFKADNYAWAKYVNGIGLRPKTPKHITQAEFPGFFDEIARLKMWRQRKQAGVPKPALGLWKYGRLPEWAAVVSKAMDAAGHYAPEPRPPTPPPAPAPNQLLVQRAQRVVFTAWRPTFCNRKVAISADVNVAGNPEQHIAWARECVAANKDSGHETAAWANQSQVGVQQLVNFGNVIGADYLIWQAETPGEMVDVGINLDGTLRLDSPMSWGPVVLIGNANSWTDKQRTTATGRVNVGKLAFIQETYTNEGDPWPEDYGTQGVPAHAISPGVGWGRYPHQLPDYHPHTPQVQWETMSPYIEETMGTTSWAVMPY